MRETMEEMERIGNFKRIFPTENVINIYSHFFEVDRPLNILIWRHIKRQATKQFQ